MDAHENLGFFMKKRENQDAPALLPSATCARTIFSFGPRLSTLDSLALITRLFFGFIFFFVLSVLSSVIFFWCINKMGHRYRHKNARSVTSLATLLWIIRCYSVYTLWPLSGTIVHPFHQRWLVFLPGSAISLSVYAWPPQSQRAAMHKPSTSDIADPTCNTGQR